MPETAHSVVVWLSLLFLHWSTYRPRSDTKYCYHENSIRLHRSELERESNIDFNNASVLTSAWTLCLMLEWLFNYVFYKLIQFSSFFTSCFVTDFNHAHCLNTFGLHTTKAQIEISVMTKTESVSTWLWHCN